MLVNAFVQRRVLIWSKEHAPIQSSASLAALGFPAQKYQTFLSPVTSNTAVHSSFSLFLPFLSVCLLKHWGERNMHYLCCRTVLTHNEPALVIKRKEHSVELIFLHASVDAPGLNLMAHTLVKTLTFAVQCNYSH